MVHQQPQYNGNGQNIGSRQTTTTYAHSTSEQMLRDLQHSDRSEYAYDAASGTMKLNHRTIIDQQEINNDLDVVHDIRTESETETEDSIQMIVQGITLTGVQTSHQSESDYRNRTRFHTTQTLNQTTTDVAYHWGENTGQTSLVRTGAPLATSFRYETLSSSDGKSKSVATHPSYNYSTTQTSKGTMATVDRVDTIHLLDGSHSSTYQGNRTLNGPGERHTYESEFFGQKESGVYEIPVEMSFGVESGNYNLTITYSDDPEGSSGDPPPAPYQYPASYLAVSSIVTAVGGFGMPSLASYLGALTMIGYEAGLRANDAFQTAGNLFDTLQQGLANLPAEGDVPENPDDENENEEA